MESGCLVGVATASAAASTAVTSATSTAASASTASALLLLGLAAGGLGRSSAARGGALEDRERVVLALEGEVRRLALLDGSARGQTLAERASEEGRDLLLALDGHQADLIDDAPAEEGGLEAGLDLRVGLALDGLVRHLELEGDRRGLLLRGGRSSGSGLRGRLRRLARGARRLTLVRVVDAAGLDDLGLLGRSSGLEQKQKQSRTSASRGWVITPLWLPLWLLLLSGCAHGQSSSGLLV